METEIEAKFLDVDPDALRKRLHSLKATLVHAERMMRRKVFDYPDERLEKIGGWVRVRDEGDKITLSYKQLNDRTLHGMKEVSVVVDDFEKACSFLLSLGLKQDSYQETRRERWMLDGNEITIDTWPWIPTFVEIEGPDEAAVKGAAGKLGLDWSRAMHGSIETAYQHYYTVTETEIDNWPRITFVPVPDWLNKKRKVQS